MKRKGTAATLTPDLRKLMGTANSLYINRQLQQAIPVLREVIRKAPLSPDPYLTLGLVYEEAKDIQKASEAYSLAAELTPQDRSLWLRIANMAKENDDLKKAVYCFSRAIRINPDDLDILWERSILYSQMGETKKAIEGIQMLLSKQPMFIQAIEELAGLFHRTDQHQRAIILLEDYLRQAESSQTTPNLNLVNILAEFLLMNGDNSKVCSLIEFSHRHMGVRNMPPELGTKLCVAKLRMGDISAAEPWISQLFTEDVESYGDLFLDISEELNSCGFPHRSLEVLDRLVTSSNYNNPEIWSKQAKCAAEIGDKSRAVQILEKILESNPNDLESRLQLASHYGALGDTQKALKAISSSTTSIGGSDLKSKFFDSSSSSATKSRSITPSSSSSKSKVEKEYFEEQNQKSNFKTSTTKSNIISSLVASQSLPSLNDIRVAHQRGSLCFQEGRYDDLITDCLPLVVRCLEETRFRVWSKETSDDIDIEGGDTTKKQKRGDSSLSDQSGSLLRDNSFLDMTILVCQSLALSNRQHEVLQLMRDTVVCAGDVGFERIHYMRLIGARCALELGDKEAAYSYARLSVAQRPTDDRALGLLSSAVYQLGYEKKCSRAILRLSTRNPNNARLRILLGHAYLSRRSYALAAQQYIIAYSITPDDKHLPLYLGMSILQHALTKSATYRHYHILQAFSFLFLYHKHQHNSESFYNLARAFHFLNLLDFAQPYYETVLTSDDSIGSPLRLHAAHNLVLLLNARRHMTRAKKIVTQFLTI